MTNGVPPIVLLILLAAFMIPVLIQYGQRFLSPSMLSGLLLKSAPRFGIAIISAFSNGHPILAQAFGSRMQVFV